VLRVVHYHLKVRGGFFGPISAYEQEGNACVVGHIGEGKDELLDEVDGSGVCPVEIIENQQHRAMLGQRDNRLTDRSEEG
jgi:hypothetical protein